MSRHLLPIAVVALVLASSACTPPEDAYTPVDELERQQAEEEAPTSQPVIPTDETDEVEPPPVDPTLPGNPALPPNTDPNAPPMDPTQVPPPSPEEPADQTMLPEPPPTS